MSAEIGANSDDSYLIHVRRVCISSRDETSESNPKVSLVLETASLLSMMTPMGAYSRSQ